MSKYQFHRMGGETFEQMAQALLEKRRRGFGVLTQFGTGADGSREATWLQPPDHPEYVRPPNETTDVAKHWVFQVKFHDIGLRGWGGAGTALVSDLRAELEKLTTKHQVKCHHYVLITNVPLSGARRIGTRDQITKVAAQWINQIPSIEVWDAVDLSRMLDNNSDVRAAYDELILPGDVIAAIYRQVQFQADRRENTFRGYLQYLLANESQARADEAGDEDPLPLSKVFVDQTLQLDRERIPEAYRDMVAAWTSDGLDKTSSKSISPNDLDIVPSSFPLLLAAPEKVMLLAGPGYGKSTLTQFLALYHASRMVKPEYAISLAGRLKLPPGISPKDLDAFCELRFPFRVELRRYAKWRKGVSDEKQPGGLATYIVRQLIGSNVASNLIEDDIFELASHNAILLILDGLDEVPNKEARDEIIKDCDAFIFRCAGENADLQIVMSSRPQGYNGEFDRFQPLQWKINDLRKEDFTDYCESWLNERIKNAEERSEARDRIKRGMESDAVRRLATTPLQATVMLTIVRRKSDIPGERHKLFAKYVDVVFEREKAKVELISQYERELRRLHETVGYRLHEAIGRGDSGRVPETRFHDYVREVWHMMRGDQYFEGVPNIECQKIVDLATDRLVFLSGKGEHQTEIDFVIQPYREYFAALYLSNHTEAVPDKVFECLVERGPFWLNVLQFYVALAKPAQQFAWIHGAVERAQQETGVNQLILEVEYQRATLATLAEYVEFPQTHFQKGISIAFPYINWWTWVGQEWAVPIVQSIRSGDGWRTLLKTAEKIETHTRENAIFTLWLLPQVIPQTAPEYQTLLTLVNRSLQRPELIEEAVAAILVYDLPITLTEDHEESLIKVMSEYSYQRRLHNKAEDTNVLARLPRRTVLRLLCSDALHFPRHESFNDPWSYLELPVELSNKEPAEAPVAPDQQIFATAPQWARIHVADQTRLRFNSQPQTDDPYESYLMTLLDAVQQPDDVELYFKAQHAETTLPHQPGWRIRSVSVLGPSPTEFDCDADWIKYKNGVKAFFKEPSSVKELNTILGTYQHPPEVGEHLWSMLIFHPKHWHLLSTMGLIPSQVVEELRSREWARLMALPKNLIEFFTQSYGYFEDEEYTLPITPVLRVAISLQNMGQLDDSALARNILLESDFSKLEATEMEVLIHSIENAPTLPESWAQIIISAAVETENIDARVLVNLWKALTGRSRIYLGRSPFVSPSGAKKARLLTQLLETSDVDSLDLAAAIALTVVDLDDKISRILNERIARALQWSAGETSLKKEHIYYALLRSRTTVAEPRLYSDPAWLKAAASLSPFIAKGIAQKIVAMPQNLARADYTALRESLVKLIEPGNAYPSEVATAALNALIQLDIANRAPLSEAMWQLPNVA
jgi:hypothetical protein